MDISALKDAFTIVTEKNLNNETLLWLKDKGSQTDDSRFNMAFVSVPRKTGKREIDVDQTDLTKVQALLPGLNIQCWTIDRFCRVWLLIHLDAKDKEVYVKRIENLFNGAEMNEQVALYSSLPLLAYPEVWKLKCAEGIRSNMGTVLEAIMYNNPYPASWLDEPAWNQLVMKAFFSDKQVNNIVGLDARANQNLANMLFDYVEERWAAHRAVNPQIWRLTGRFMDESHFYMMEKLFKQDNEIDQQAAALACADSSFGKTKLLLDESPEHKKAIVQKKLTWQVIAESSNF